MENDWIQGLSILTNVGVFIVGIKLVRHLTGIEFKVDMMWKHFEKEINNRD
jgi:hypothetical protein